MIKELRQVAQPRQNCQAVQELERSPCRVDSSTTLLDPQMEIPEFHHGFQVVRMRD